jgi:hypothetical protein
MPLIALAGFALVAAPKANAAPTLTIMSNETTGAMASTTVLDNSAADQDSTIGNLVLGSSSAGLTFGDFTVFGSRTVSNAQAPNGPPVTVSTLSSGALAVTNNTSSPQSIVFQASDINYTGPPSPLILAASASGTFRPDGSNSSVAGATATAKAWADASNTLFGHGTLVQNYTFTAGSGFGSQSYSNSANLSNFNYSGAYSMTVELDFTVPGNSTLVTRSDVIQGFSQAVPEPTTLAGLGMGMVAAIGFARRRRLAV